MFILKYTLYSKTILKSDNCLHYLFSINYFSLALLTARPRGPPSGAKDFGGLRLVLIGIHWKYLWDDTSDESLDSLFLVIVIVNILCTPRQMDLTDMIFFLHDMVTKFQQRA